SVGIFSNYLESVGTFSDFLPLLYHFFFEEHENIFRFFI
uniref:Uncharacterized protein n=1 Tax=Amphimedon queenslandica TaxID=400682 RepID=A0A1X7SXW3_AMPQE